MIAGTPSEAHAGLPQRQNGEAENQRRDEIGGARVHGVNAMRRSTSARGEPDEADERRRKRGGGEQRRPDLHGLAVIGAGQQARAEAAVLALGHLGDHRPDQGRRGADLHAGEEERRARRRAQLDEGLRRRRRIGAHEIELQRIGRTQTLDHADGDREEREIGGDHRLGREPGDVELIENDHDHRRQRDDRHGLRGDDPRHHRSLEAAHREDQDRQADPERQRRRRSRSASPAR